MPRLHTAQPFQLVSAFAIKDNGNKKIASSKLALPLIKNTSLTEFPLFKLPIRDMAEIVFSAAITE
jgi:hypothetical protein